MPTGPPTVRCLWPVRLLLSIAALVDVYLLWVSASGGMLVGCGPESNCHTVLNSRWAAWYGVPVSAPALMVYAALFLGTFALDAGPRAPSRPRAWRWLLACAVTVLGAGLWFSGLQVFALKTICPYCMTAHACGMGAAALLCWQASAIRSVPAQGKTRDLVRLRARDILLPVGGAVMAVAALIVGQVLHQPKSYSSDRIAAGVVTNSAIASARLFQIFDGEIQFQLNEVPLIGKPEAQHVIVSLFDYTCHHCRQMHPLLLSAYHQFSNQLAIVNLPMPLDRHCNPRVSRTLPPHTNACALARVGLTVWTADRTKSATFDDWVFTPETPPLPVVAEAYARQLVGDGAFRKASTNAWIEAQLQRDIAIYAANRHRFRKGVMPQVIIGTNLISGVFSYDQLFGMLAEQFRL